MSPRVRTSVFDIESLLLDPRINCQKWVSERKMEDNDVLLEFTRNDVRENLELAMRVCTEPFETRDAVFVNYAQRAVLLVFRVLVPADPSGFCPFDYQVNIAFEDSHSEREGMVCVEPTVVGVSALFASAGDEVEGAAHFVIVRCWCGFWRNGRSRGCCETLWSMITSGA
jgi:hypothetical protein